MFRSSYEIGRIFGVPIRVEMSLIVMAVWMWWHYGVVRGAFAAATLMVAIVLHELGHSLVGMRMGCRVRDITLMLIGGRATLLDLPREPWKELLMALAGPAVSAALGFGALFAVPSIAAFAGPKAAGMVLLHVAYLNLALCIFNLLPAFPMDGGRVLRALLSQRLGRLRGTYIASRVGRILAIVMGVWALRDLRDPQIFLVLIAVFVFQAAGAEYRMVQMEAAHDGNPFRNPWGSPPPPPDDQAVVSPPPYRRGRDVTDVYKDR